MIDIISLGSHVAILLFLFFVGMRIMYGYWPWQVHPALRSRLERQNTSSNFKPIAIGAEIDPTKPPPFPIGGSVGEKPATVVRLVPYPQFKALFNESEDSFIRDPIPSTDALKQEMVRALESPSSPQPPETTPQRPEPGADSGVNGK